jgi:deoxyribodipyrimidine photo-lyase
MGRIEQENLGIVIGRDYPAPIVDHSSAREETLARYGILKLGKKTG